MIRDFYLTHISIQLYAVIGGCFIYLKEKFTCKFNLYVGNFIYKTTKDYLHLLMIQ